MEKEQVSPKSVKTRHRSRPGRSPECTSLHKQGPVSFSFGLLLQIFVTKDLVINYLDVLMTSMWTGHPNSDSSWQGVTGFWTEGIYVIMQFRQLLTCWMFKKFQRVDTTWSGLSHPSGYQPRLATSGDQFYTTWAHRDNLHSPPHRWLRTSGWCKAFIIIVQFSNKILILFRMNRTLNIKLRPDWIPPFTFT